MLCTKDNLEEKTAFFKELDILQLKHIARGTTMKNGPNLSRSEFFIFKWQLPRSATTC